MAGLDDSGSNPDVSLLYDINGLAEDAPGWLARTMEFVGEYGLLLALVLLVVWCWWGARRRPVLDDAASSVAAVVWAPLAAGIAVLVNVPIRGFVERPRPFVDHQGLEVLVDGKTDYSFVSDHATLAMAIGVGLFVADRLARTEQRASCHLIMTEPGGAATVSSRRGQARRPRHGRDRLHRHRRDVGGALRPHRCGRWVVRLPQWVRRREAREYRSCTGTEPIPVLPSEHGNDVWAVLSGGDGLGGAHREVDTAGGPRAPVRQHALQRPPSRGPAHVTGAAVQAAQDPRARRCRPAGSARRGRRRTASGRSARSSR